MTSIAVTASICASASEAALLLATFMPTSLDSGMTHRCANAPIDGQNFYSEHPTTIFALTSPHSANIDCLRVEQYCGGFLARLQPVCARGMEFSKRDLPQGGIGRAVARAAVASYCFQ